MFRNRQETIAPSASSVKANEKRAELAELGKIEEQYKKQINQLEKQLDDLSCEKEERVKNLLELKDVKEELALVIKFVDSAKAELESARKDKEALEIANASAQEIIDKISEDISNLQLEKNSLTDEVKDLKVVKSDLDSAKTEMANVLSEISDLEKQLAEKKEDFAKQMTELDMSYALKDRELSDDINSLTSQKNKLSIDVDGLRKESELLKDKMLKLVNGAKSEADNIVSTATERANIIKTELDKRDGELSIKEKFLESRTELLRSVKDQLENKLGKKIDIVEF
jgi:chromosome segregation ATPase